MVTVLALADEVRLNEKVKMYPCLYETNDIRIQSEGRPPEFLECRCRIT